MSYEDHRKKMEDFGSRVSSYAASQEAGTRKATKERLENRHVLGEKGKSTSKSISKAKSDMIQNALNRKKK